jgi:predicted GIY-YIG superfamily endonuclease
VEAEGPYDGWKHYCGWQEKRGRMYKHYFVYIMSSQRRVLYIGISSNLEQRVYQHKRHAFPGFTEKYNVTNLV